MSKPESDALRPSSDADRPWVPSDPLASAESFWDRYVELRFDVERDALLSGDLSAWRDAEKIAMHRLFFEMGKSR